MPANDDGRVSYLEKVIEKDPNNPYLQERLEMLLNPAPAVPPGEEKTVAENRADEASAESAAAEAPEAKPIPICGTYQ